MGTWSVSQKRSGFRCFVGITYSPNFYPIALKGCRGIVFTHGVRMGRRVGGRWELVCPDSISETVRCRKFILGRDIGWGCRCATSWSDLDLTFDLAVVTLSLKILSGLYLGNHKV